MLLRVILESWFEQDGKGILERLQPTRLENLGLAFPGLNAMKAVQSRHDTADQVNTSRASRQSDADLPDTRKRPFGTARHHAILMGGSALGDYKPVWSVKGGWCQRG
jgi:hypothetical protein